MVGSFLSYWLYPDGKQLGSAPSLACAFCKSKPFEIPFAPDGSKVHELEHEAGGVNWLDIASVVMVSVSVALATSVGFVDVILNTAAKVRGMEYGVQSSEEGRRILSHDEIGVLAPNALRGVS